VVTVTLQVAVLALSTVVAVILVVPIPTAVTNPVLLTVAKAVLLEAQVTLILVALVGLMLAVNWSLPPAAIVLRFLLRVIPLTGMVTVTMQVAVYPPSNVVTVIVATPSPLTPFTFLFASTVATVLSLVLQPTILFPAVDGLVVATRLSLVPALIVVLLY